MDFLFDSKLNRILQSFDSGWFTVAMLLVSASGSIGFLTGAGGFVLFRIHFRKGLLLLHTLLWSSLLTDFCKVLFGLPRPTDVDPSVSLLQHHYPQWLLDYFPVRMNFGFPSGHVASTTVFWGALMLLFSNRFLRILGAFVIAFMALSRMYLGRHFLGDVLGGFLLGVMILAVMKWIVLPRFRAPNAKSDAAPDETISSTSFFVCLVVLPLLAAPYLAKFAADDAGRLIGVSVASFVLLIRGLPEEDHDSGRGLGRFAVAALLYATLNIFFAFLSDSATSGDWLSVLSGAIPAFLGIWGAVEITTRWGLYKPDSNR